MKEERKPNYSLFIVLGGIAGLLFCILYRLKDIFELLKTMQ